MQSHLKNYLRQGHWANFNVSHSCMVESDIFFQLKEHTLLQGDLVLSKIVKIQLRL